MFLVLGYIGGGFLRVSQFAAEALMSAIPASDVPLESEIPMLQWVAEAPTKKPGLRIPTVIKLRFLVPIRSI